MVRNTVFWLMFVSYWKCTFGCHKYFRHFVFVVVEWITAIGRVISDMPHLLSATNKTSIFGSIQSRCFGVSEHRVLPHSWVLRTNTFIFLIYTIFVADQNNVGWNSNNKNMLNILTAWPFNGLRSIFVRLAHFRSAKFLKKKKGGFVKRPKRALWLLVTGERKILFYGLLTPS